MAFRTHSDKFSRKAQPKKTMRVSACLIILKSEAGMKHFVLKYGFKHASCILNSIDQYPPRSMMILLHSFQHELKKTTIPKHRRLLQAQIVKLNNQINIKQIEYKEKLTDIFLQSQNLSESETNVNEVESWTLHRLIDHLLSQMDEIKEEEFLRERKQFEEATKHRIKKYKKYKIIRVKREIMWNYAEKIIQKKYDLADSVENDSNASFFRPRTDYVEHTCALICGEVCKYVVIDCGHYCLCGKGGCKTHFEIEGNKKCPLCRVPITKLMRVKPTFIGNKCAQDHCSNEREYLFVDCGHYCVCGNCKTQIENNDKKCPICKKIATKIIRIFVK